MKPRNWILILGSSLMLLIVALTLWLNYADINREIRRSIVAAVKQTGVEGFAIGQVRLKLNSLELRDVHLELPEAGVTMEVERITALFSLSEYFSSGFDPVQSLPYFIIERPVVHLYPPEAAPSSDTTPWWRQLPSTSFIHRFFLVDGRVSYRTAEGETQPWHFSAHLGNPDSERRQLSLNLGPTAATTDALQIKAEVNLFSSDGSLQLHADTLCLTAADLTPGDLPLDWRELSSIAHFQMDFDSTTSSLRGQALLELRDLTLAPELTLPLVKLRLVGRGDSLSVELTDVEGAPGRVEAAAVLRRDGFSFHSTVIELDLAASRYWLEDTLLTGSATLDCSGFGSWSAPQLALGLTTPELHLAGQPPAQAVLFLTADSSRLHLRELQLRWPDRHLTLDGTLHDLSAAAWAPDLQWRVTGDLPQLPLRLQAEGILSCPEGDWWLSGTSELRPAAPGLPPLSGSVELRERMLHFTSAPAHPAGYCLEVELGDPLNWQLNLDQLEQLLPYLGVDALPAGCGGKASLTGDLTGAAAELSLHWRRQLLQLTAEIGFEERQLAGTLLLPGGIGRTLSGTLLFNWQQPDLLVLESFRLDDALQVSGAFNTARAAGELAVTCERWPWQRLNQLSLIKRMPPGVLSADFELQFAAGEYLPAGFIELGEAYVPGMRGDRLRLEAAVLQDSIRCHLWTFADRQPLLEYGAVFDRRLENGLVQLATGPIKPDAIFDLPDRLGGDLELNLEAECRDRRWELAAVVDWQRPEYKRFQCDQLTLALHTRDQLTSWALDTLSLTRRRGEYPLVIFGHGALGGADDSLLIGGHGDLFEFISSGSDLLRSAESYCTFELLLQGTPTEPLPVRGFFRTSNTVLKPAIITPRISDLDLDVELADGRLYIHEMRSKHPVGRLNIRNRFEPPPESPELESLVLPGLGINLGILVISDEQHGMQTVPGVELNIPGLMKPKWSGRLHFTGKRGKGNCHLAGPVERPLLQGRIELSRTEFTYPLLGAPDPEAAAEDPLVDFVNRLRWDLELEVGLSNNYVNDIEGFTDWQYGNLVPDFFKTIHTRVILDPGDRLHLTGSLLDETFRLTGRVNSNRGTVRLLNQQFNIVETGLEFDKSTLFPVVHGKASLTVTDSTGFNKDIYLTLYLLDEEGNRLVRGRWGDMTFELSDDYGSPQTQILAEMGFGAGMVETTMQDISGSLLQQAMLPYMTRVEQSIQQLFGLDVVQLRTDVVSNYLDTRLFTSNGTGSPEEMTKMTGSDALGLLAGSNFVVGKFITPRIMLSYSGTLFKQYQEELLVNDLQYRQALKVDYRITRNLGMMVEMAYDPIFRYDERIMLRFRQFY